jgi:glutamate carboxypeptidase
MPTSSDIAVKLLDWLPSRLPEALEWLERMVKINSFSTHPAGVNAVGEVTAECFAELGFTSEFVPSTDSSYGSHLFLKCEGTGKQRILLVTHLDTVFPPEEEIREAFTWEPAPAEDRIYGPGSVDIKGGTVLIRLLLEALREFAPQVFAETEWLVAADASEEVMSADFAKQVSKRCPGGATAVLVFEGAPLVAGDYHLVTSRKGRAEYRIRAEGRAAHAGSSHAEGINAIVALSTLLPKVAALTDYSEELTINIGSIAGGSVLNRVPHAATAELEMRAYEPGTLHLAGKEILALSQSQPLGARIVAECLGTTPAWPNDVRTQGLYRDWAAVGEELGMRTVSVSRGGLSDANYLCHLGPTLDGLGPVGGNAHCSERSADGSKVPEFVVTSSFVPKAALSALALMRMLSRKEA